MKPGPCGSMCYLEYLAGLQEPLDPAWVVDGPQAPAFEEGTPVQDDVSICRSVVVNYMFITGFKLMSFTCVKWFACP